LNLASEIDPKYDTFFFSLRQNDPPEIEVWPLSRLPVPIPRLKWLKTTANTASKCEPIKIIQKKETKI